MHQIPIIPQTHSMLQLYLQVNLLFSQSMEAAHYSKVRIHGQLDLDAPLMSTRRSWSSVDMSDVAGKNSDASSRVPFSWESSPGVPKDAGRAQRCSSFGNSEPLTPRPPPVRRGSLREDCNVADDRHSDRSSDRGSFVDAMDRMSLSETFAPRQSSSFIMDRFLPAANAIAGGARRRPDAKLQVQLARRGERPSTMACGLVLFFPWSLKPTVCGVESPVRVRTPRKIVKDVSHEFCSSEEYDEQMRSRRCQTPRWELSFSDRRNNIAKAQSNQGRMDGKVCSLPQLKPPSDSWLSHALNSKNRRC